MKGAVVILLFLCCFDVKAQNLDSLIKLTDTFSDTDTNKITNYCDIALKQIAIDEVDKALKLLKKSESLLDKCKNKRASALFYYVIGRAYYAKGNYKESLSYILRSMKLYEEQNNKGRIGACCNVIGLIYQDQTFYDKAQVFLNKTLEISIERHDSMRLSGNYSNVGLNYYKQAHKKKITGKDCFEMREAIKNLNAALVVAKRMRLPSAEATALGNLSNLMNDKGQYIEAKLFAERALKIYQNLGDAYEEAISLIDIASISLAQNNPKDAIPYLQKCLDISTSNQFKDLDRYTYLNLATAYEKLNNYKQAFFYEKILLALNDSIFNSENLKQINEMQIKYETDKKESENEFLTVKNELSDKAIKNQKAVIVAVITGLILMFVFSFFIFRGLKKQKQANRIISQQKKDVEDKNHLINEQKELLEEKQKEILDSINYARRIQQAQMPTDKYVAKNIDRLKKNS